MGSRLRPNHGGSGFAHTRLTRPSQPEKAPVRYQPISTAAELEAYLSGSKIACLLCGKEMRSLGHHLSRSHAMSPDDYKVKFNIPVTRSLACEDLREIKKAITERIWQENPRMEAVRQSLKENIDRLDGTKHKTKSSIKGLSEIKRARTATNGAANTWRDRYLDVLRTSIQHGRLLSEVVAERGFNRNKITGYLLAHDDPEIRQLFEIAKNFEDNQHRASLTYVTCTICGKIAQRAPSNVNEGANYCSRHCQSVGAISRTPTPCVVCGKEMSLTPSDKRRITTCSKECSTIRRSKAATGQAARHLNH
jgi:endogenous inhibitor of DNA gyrase (YacG/DUF329 family)